MEFKSDKPDEKDITNLDPCDNNAQGKIFGEFNQKESSYRRPILSKSKHMQDINLEVEFKILGLASI